MLLTIVIIFLAAMIAVGYFASRKVSNSGDYYLGNKEFGPWTTAFKFATTWESGSKLVGSPAMAYRSGMVAFLQGLTSPLAYLMSFRVFGPRVKAACDFFGTTTTPEMLGRRYRSSAIHTVSAIALFIGLMGTLVGQFQAIGSVVSAVLGIHYAGALCLGIVIIGFYTITGGYRASVWTDLGQGIIMIIGSITLFVFVIHNTPNWSIPSLNAQLNGIQSTMLHITGGRTMTWLTLSIYIVIPLFMGIALPQQTVAIFSMKDRRVGNASLIICTLFSVILIWCLYLAAMTVKADPSFHVGNTETLTTSMAIAYMPTLLAGIFISAILAAIMSTCDGVLLVASSILTQDLFLRVKPDTYKKHPVLYNRIATAVVVIIPFAFSIKPPAAIFWVISFSMAITVFTFALPMLGVVYIRRATKQAALIQIIVTAVIIPVWVIFSLGKYTGISSLSIGMIVAPLVFFPVMFLSKADKSEEIDQLWEEYRNIKKSSSVTA